MLLILFFFFGLSLMDCSARGGGPSVSKFGMGVESCGGALSLSNLICFCLKDLYDLNKHCSWPSWFFPSHGFIFKSPLGGLNYLSPILHFL